MGIRASRLVCAGFAVLACGAAGAQQPQPAPAAAAGPGGPAALADYRPFADVPPLAWKEANDTVGRIGGWRAYAREAQAASAPAAPASAPAAPRAADPHGGHRGRP